MKILVAVKRVIDPYVRVRVKNDGSGVELQNMKMSMNPFDEIALEEAIRLREQAQADEVVIVSIGSKENEDILRHGLALGADRATLITTSSSQHCSLHIAKILQKVIQDEQPNLVMLGKQSIDSDSNQTAQMLAALLDWPQATFASDLKKSGDDITVAREIDAGIEEIQVTLPAVISSDLRLNEPRYASLPNIMQAKRKPLQEIALDELGLELKPQKEILEVVAPVQRSKGEMVASVADLVDKLQQEAKVV